MTCIICVQVHMLTQQVYKKVGVVITQKGKNITSYLYTVLEYPHMYITLHVLYISIIYITIYIWYKKV